MKYLLGVVAFVSAFWLAMTAESASAAPGDIEIESPEFAITGSCGGGTFNPDVRFATRTSGPPTSDTDLDINVGSGVVPSFWIYVPGSTEVYGGVTTNFLVAGSDIEVNAGSVTRNAGWSRLASAPEYVVTDADAGTVLEFSTTRLRIVQYSMDCSIPAGDGLVGLYVNKAPVLADDDASTQAGSPVTIDVLANDDATWDSGTISSSYPTVTELAAQDDLVHVPAESLATALAVAAYPSNGAVAISADGTITYTPNPGFVGSDSFVYALTDNDGASSEATVALDVAAPTAVGDPELAATGAGMVPGWLAVSALLVFAGAGLVMRSRRA